MRNYIIVFVCILAAAAVYGKSDELKFFPQEITAFYSVDLKAAKGIRWFGELFDRPGNYLEGFKKITGEDIKKGLTHAILAVKHLPESKRPIKDVPGQIYFVFRGKFDSKVANNLARLAKGDCRTTKYEGETVLYSKEKTHAYCFLNTSTLLMGTLDSVKEMIGIQKKKTPSAVRNKSIMAILPKFEDRTFFWGFYLPGAIIRSKAASSSEINRMKARARSRYSEDMIHSFSSVTFESNISTEFINKQIGHRDYAITTITYKYNDKEIPDKIFSNIRNLKNQIANLKRYASSHGSHLGRHKIGFGFLESVKYTANGLLLITRTKCMKVHFDHHLNGGGSYLEHLFDRFLANIPEGGEFEFTEVKEEEAF
jgi:hypothetical protein